MPETTPGIPMTIDTKDLTEGDDIDLLSIAESEIPTFDGKRSNG